MELSAIWTAQVFLLLGLASALVAGVFLAFSDFVIAGLARSAGHGGLESMQHLNRTVFRSLFLALFLALVPLTMLAAGYAAMQLGGAARALPIAGGIVYFSATFLVTVTANVPMNERLDALPPDGREAAAYWRSYVPAWTRWNHLRTAGSALCALCFLQAALLVR